MSKKAKYITKCTPSLWIINCDDTETYSVVSVETGQPICYLSENAERGGGLNFDDGDNARLIAAAPTMFEYIRKQAEAGDTDASKLISTITKAKAGDPP